jgi:4-hydroxybenzoate polyprenyltransferase
MDHFFHKGCEPGTGKLNLIELDCRLRCLLIWAKLLGSTRMKSTAAQPADSGPADSLPLEPAQKPGFKPLQLVVLLRPKQWSKNLLVFAAPLFTGSISDPARLFPALYAFAALCLASSSIYVINDLLDIERDRQHPKKRKRPLASGAVPIGVAIALTPLLVIGSIVLALFASLNAAILVGCYLALHSTYNLGMKHTAIADVFAISLGFVLRAIIGAAAIHVTISGWLLFCTGALALMLGYGKRRQEFIFRGEERGLTRESLNQYSLKALDALVIMSATAAGLAYGVYAINSKTALQYPSLVLTALPVIYGISRYILVAFTQDEGGEPESLLFSDKHILLSVVAFIALAVFAMSGFQLPFLEVPL